MRNCSFAILVRSLAACFVTLLTLFALPSAAQNLELNGMAIHSELRRDYYIGAFYVAVPSSSADELLNSEQDKKMVLRVLAKRWSARSFEQHWTQSILINNNEEDLASFADSILAFTSAVGGKLVSGDEIIVNSPMGQALTMTVNGEEVFSLAENGNGFFSLLLNGWIGARPPSSNFKRDILTKPNDVASLQSIFDGLSPAEGREAEVQAWANSSDEEEANQAASAPAPVATPAPRPQPSAEEIAQRAAARAAAAAAAAKAQAEAEAEAAAKAEAERKAEEERIAKEVEQKNAGLRLLYRSNVMKMIYTRVVYPSRAIDRDQEGVVELKVRLKRNGKLIEATVNTESQYNLLNRAAVRAAEDAAPYPAAPEKLSDKEIELLIPIRFKIPG